MLKVRLAKLYSVLPMPDQADTHLHLLSDAQNFHSESHAKSLDVDLCWIVIKVSLARRRLAEVTQI